MERFEQLLGTFIFETDTGILHRKSHMIVIVSFGFNHHVPGPIVDATHRFGGVKKQVQDDLLKLDTIAGDGWEIFGKYGAQARVVPLNFVLRQRNHFSCHLVQIY